MSDIVVRPVRRFPGFPDRMELIPVPGAVFGTLLREIDDLNELKTLLHVLRLLHAQPRAPRFVRRASLLADVGLIEALTVPAGHDSEAAVAEALRMAVDRGTLLSIAVSDGAGPDVCYLLNTHANERIVQQVMAGQRTLGDLGPAPTPREPTIAGQRPTIYDLYEQNIGLLTPLLAEELHEAAATFPAAWIEDAFREAVGQNRRNWRYVRRILDNWASRGRGTGGATWRRPEAPQTSGDYLETRYGRLLPR
jgi:DnaD/phage-associated family protein